MAGEFDFINWIASQQQADDFVRVPVGDDLAVLNWPGGDLLIVGVDQVLDGVHFDSREHSPRQIGAKVMNRNLSDCAAMAARPAAAVATVALPRGTKIAYAKELYLGMAEAGAKFNCRVVGGDTGTWAGKLVMSVTILARSDGIEPITRKGARAGDGIYVTGHLGGSLLGRHMKFSPRVDLARQLAGTGKITSMIDLSDGISRDLKHICSQSRVGAVIEAGAVPIHADALAISKRDQRSPLEHALHDGEDYELLFTTSSTPPAGFRIGTITRTPGIFLQEADQRVALEPKGWEHSL
jgi:thiamine-monophosphate kinase